MKIRRNPAEELRAKDPCPGTKYAISEYAETIKNATGQYAGIVKGKPEKPKASLIAAADKFIEKVRPKAPCSQAVYVTEECAELTKELAKRARGKGNVNAIRSEACDVIASTLILVRELGMSEDEIKQHIMAKYSRAIKRARDSGEF